MKRLSSVVLLLAVALVLLGSPLFAQDTHTGEFVSAAGNQFTMKSKDKVHTHTLAPDGKVVGEDGKECKLADIKAGAPIRVTTKTGDIATATKVEVMKKDK
jgi:hypothetical protein